MAVDTVIPGPKVTSTQKQKIPFRRATVERTAILNTLSPTLATTETPQLNEVKGTGYIYGVTVDVNATASGNSAAVAFTEDAPWTALSSVILSDVNGELVNLNGFDLYLVNLAMAQYRGTFWDAQSRGQGSLVTTMTRNAPIEEFTLTMSPALVAANTTAEQSFAAPVATADVIIAVNKPTAQAGLALGQARITSAGQVAITFINDTAGGLTPTASETYEFVVYRKSAILTQSQFGTNFYNLVPGAAGSGGSFRFQLRVPVGINRRDLIGLIGNQDRAQKYELRQNLNASGGIYATSPTVLPVVNIANIYENYTVPLSTSPSGAPQEQFPPTFGTLHFLTAANLSELPTASGTITHFLKRVGNTARYLILIFRNGASATAPRTSAEQNAPSKIVFKVGEDPIFSESYVYRRQLMQERYGFEWPAGVVIYDAMHDFQAGAGNEVGDDYYHTQALVNAQFEISYPGGWSGTSSLRVITDDMLFVPPQQVVPS